MELVFKKNIVEKINDAMAMAKRSNKVVEAILVTEGEAQELYLLAFRDYTRYYTGSFLTRGANFAREVRRGEVSYRGLPVRIQQGECHV